MPIELLAEQQLLIKRIKRENFANWQQQYAERGIVTFPVEIQEINNKKKPMIGNPNKIGLPRSSFLATQPQYASAAAIGAWAGWRNNFTIIDWDSTDEKGFADRLQIHGEAKLIVCTPTKKFHGYYLNNGEPRLIKPRGLPLDLLGSGLVVLPPS
jgi:hypothetical protein